MGDLDGRIATNEHLKGDYWLMVLDLAGEIQAPQPGRFLMVKVTDQQDPLLRRPFGIHDFEPAGEGGRRLKILYKVIGRGTDLMTRMRPDRTVDIIGPLGRGFDLPPTGERAAILAGGIGGAPLLYLARKMIEAGSSPVVYAGGNTAEDVLGAGEFESLGVTFRRATLDGSEGFRGTVVDLFLEEEGGDSILHVYACGPWGMLGSLAGSCEERGWSMQATVDSVMACGMGICMGCSLEKRVPEEGRRYVSACRDGPVFHLEDIRW